MSLVPYTSSWSVSGVIIDVASFVFVYGRGRVSRSDSSLTSFVRRMRKLVWKPEMALAFKKGGCWKIAWFFPAKKSFQRYYLRQLLSNSVESFVSFLCVLMHTSGDFRSFLCQALSSLCHLRIIVFLPFSLTDCNLFIFLGFCSFRAFLSKHSNQVVKNVKKVPTNSQFPSMENKPGCQETFRKI